MLTLRSSSSWSVEDIKLKNFQDYHNLYIVTTWQIFIKFWDGHVQSSEMLSYLVWNDPYRSPPLQNDKFSKCVIWSTDQEFFLFHRNVMFRSQDIQVLVFLTIPWFTKSVTSRWVLVHETRYIFEYIFWTTTHEVTKLGQLIDISNGNNSK